MIPFPVYIRGEAYLAAKRGPEAAREFQRIVDAKYPLQNCVLRPLALVGLARAQVLSGDKAKAKASYQEFLAIWKDADHDLPLLKKAKAELDALN